MQNLCFGTNEYRRRVISVFVSLVLFVGLTLPFVGSPEEIVEADEEPILPKEEKPTMETIEEQPVKSVEPMNGEEQQESQIRQAIPYGTYQVQRGDSLYWIAETYSISIEELKELNQLSSDAISVGQLLRVPLHTLKEYPVGLQLTSQEVQWLAQMIHAEARGEPYIGQVAVGAVIINRILSNQFPNTLRGVLFQENAFQPIRNGSFYRPPNDMAKRAALEALSGHDPTNGALFFFNPRQSTDRYMHSRPAVVTIGRHRFTN
ncbi:MAG: LysM peptidoglycan-binding domain-containing protein [Firmicutes bacterium]|nr:LysM peptidoglycan-binding domain-containing protein [Bacillota bacterium]